VAPAAAGAGAGPGQVAVPRLAGDGAQDGAARANGQSAPVTESGGKKPA